MYAFLNSLVIKPFLRKLRLPLVTLGENLFGSAFSDFDDLQSPECVSVGVVRRIVQAAENISCRVADCLIRICVKLINNCVSFGGVLDLFDLVSLLFAPFSGFFVSVFETQSCFILFQCCIPLYVFFSVKYTLKSTKIDFNV